MNEPVIIDFIAPRKMGLFKKMKKQDMKVMINPQTGNLVIRRKNKIFEINLTKVKPPMGG